MLPSGNKDFIIIIIIMIPWSKLKTDKQQRRLWPNLYVTNATIGSRIEEFYQRQISFIEL